MKKYIIWQHTNVRRRCSLEFEAENDEQAKLVFKNAVKDEYDFNWCIRKYDEDCDAPDTSMELAEMHPKFGEMTICGLDIRDGEPRHRDAIEFVKRVAALKAGGGQETLDALILEAKKLIPKE